MLATILLLAAIFVRAAIFCAGSNFCASSNFRASSKFTVDSHFRARRKLVLVAIFCPLCYVYTMFLAATSGTTARNVARSGFFLSFLSSSSSSVSCYVLSLSDKVIVTEARRRAMICHGWLYVSSQSVTFTSSYVPTKFCYVYQVPSSVKVFYGEMWMMCRVSARLCPWYKTRPTKLLQSLIRKHH